MSALAVPAARRRDIDDAMVELQGLILAEHPTAMFAVEYGDDDPFGPFLIVTLEVDDALADEVWALYGDRLFEMQVEEGLSIHVLPLEAPR